MLTEGLLESLGGIRMLRFALVTVFLIAGGRSGIAAEVRVRDSAGLAEALRQATPGTTLQIEPGQYEVAISRRDLRGTAEQPIVIQAADLNRPPVLQGVGVGLHLSRPAHVELRSLILKSGSGNGLNLDDGGARDGSAEHLVLADLRVLGDGGRGNRDGIKLSGLRNFQVLRCTVERWGTSGSGIDMVGCHEGVVEECLFRHANADFANGVQAKGGSRKISIRRCRFDHAGGRAVNLGGSTNIDYFRPRPQGYEAQDLLVEDCTFVGSMAPIAFVGVDGAIVRFNTIYHPRKWVIRILQENTGADFVPCQNGRFENNVIVFRSADVRSAVNIGGGTKPESFRFRQNVWHCEDRPRDTQRFLQLPVPEADGIFVDPQLSDPEKGDFAARSISARGAGVRDKSPESSRNSN